MRNLRWGVNKMGGALFWSAAALALLAAFCWAQNNWIVTKRYVLYSRRIQAPMRIVQLSDLHGKRFGRQNRRLLGKIQRLSLIHISGQFGKRKNAKVKSRSESTVQAVACTFLKAGLGLESAQRAQRGEKHDRKRK